MSSLQQWTPTTLGELLIFTGGSQPPLSVFSKTEHEGYIRLIQIRDYKTDKYTTYIPKDLARRFCDADDIMIGRYGPPIFQILRGLEGAYNVALIKVTPKGNIFKDFAWHYLRNDRLFKHIDKLSRRTSGQTGVDLNELENYPIQLPPLAEQQKIAQALTDADNYIFALEKLIEKKKMIKEGLMVNLLTGKQRLKEFAFNEDGTAKGYKDSELGKIPEDWEIQELRNLILATPNYGINAAAEPFDLNKFNYLRITDIDEDGNLIEENLSSISNSQANNYLLNEGDIVIARTGASVGKSFIYKNLNKSFVFAGFLIRIQPDHQKIDPSFLFLYTQTKIYKNWIQTNSMRSGQPGINSNELMTLKILLPALQEQIDISKTIDDIKKEINMLNKKLTKANHIKNGMMQKLHTGEIRLA